MEALTAIKTYEADHRTRLRAVEGYCELLELAQGKVQQKGNDAGRPRINLGRSSRSARGHDPAESLWTPPLAELEPVPWKRATCGSLRSAAGHARRAWALRAGAANPTR